MMIEPQENVQQKIQNNISFKKYYSEKREREGEHNNNNNIT